MKTHVSLHALILFAILSCQTKPDSESEKPAEVNFEREKEAIMKIIDGESKAFWDKDYDKWASYWAHEPYVRTMGWWDAGGVTVVSGWGERSKRTKEHMESSPEANATAMQVKRENLNIRIYNDIAWLTFDQYGIDTGDTLMDMPGLSRETRILEKQNGQWKIAYVGWLLEGPKNE